MSADPLPSTQPLVAACITLAFAALFTGVDTALTSLSRARLAALAQACAPRYRAVVASAIGHRQLVQSRYMAWRVLTVSGMAASYGFWLSTLPGRQMWIGAGAGAMLVMLLLHLASSLARNHADWVVPFALWLLRPLSWLVAPIAWLLNGMATLAFPFLRHSRNADVIEAEMEMMVEHGQQSGVFEHEPAKMMRNLLDFADLTARDAMVPRTQMVGIQLDTPIDQVLRTIIESGHSRYPVYEKDADDIFGLLYAKDLFRLINTDSTPVADSTGQPARAGAGDSQAPPSMHSTLLSDIVRPNVRLVPESKPLAELLAEMKQDRQHLVIVVDEFGGTSGIVTLEDVLEEIVGDIRDEYDSLETPIVELGRGRLLADAAMPLAHLSAYLGSELDPDDEYDSVGGMLTAKLGKVPSPGTSLGQDGFRFIVRESDAKHVTKVEVVRQNADTTDSSDALPAAS